MIRATPDSGRLLLRPQEAANTLGVSLRTLMNWVADGSIPYVRCGERCLRFSTADLEVWIRERSTRRPARVPEGPEQSATSPVNPGAGRARGAIGAANGQGGPGR